MSYGQSQASSADKKQEEMARQMLRTQFLHEINLVSMCLGCEFRMVVIMKDGYILPALKFKRAKRSNAGEIASVRELYTERRKSYYDFMKMPKDTPVLFSDRYIGFTEKILSYLWPAKALWRIYLKIECDYSLMLSPVIVYQSNYIGAHYEVVEKQQSTHRPLTNETKQV